MSKILLKAGIVILGAAALTVLASATASALCANLSTDFLVPAPVGSRIAAEDVDSDGYYDAVSFSIVVLNAAASNINADVWMSLVSPNGSVSYLAASGSFQVPASSYQGVYARLDLLTTDRAGQWTASYNLTELTGPAPQPVCESLSLLFDLYPLGDYVPQVSSLPSGQVIEQNATATYAVRVRNGGNLPDSLDVVANSNRGWTVDNRSGSFDLAPGEYADILITVHSPLNTAPTTAEITAVLVASRRDAARSASVMLYTSVAAQVFSPEITGDPTSGLGVPGSVVSFNLTVTNHGNNRDAITLAGSVSEQGWSLNFPAPFGALNAGESVVVQVSVNVPMPITPLWAWDPMVIAFSQDAVTSGSVVLAVTSVFADFAVAPSDIVLPSGTINEGDEVIIAVTVHNLGPFAAGDVSFTISVGSAVPYMTVVQIIAGSGGNVTLSAPFDAVAGGSMITVEVDGANAFPEPNESDNTASLMLPVNARPSASLASPAGALAGVPVELDGGTSVDDDGEVVLFLFVFGDGTDSGWVSTPKVTHAYATGGNFSTTLTVRDDRGAESVNVAAVAVAVNQRPTASLEAQALVTLGMQAPIFANSSSDSDGQVVSYLFLFGDGTESGWVATSNVTHTYASAGDFTLTLRVRDNLGGESNNTPSIQVHVNARPTAAVVAPATATTGLGVAISANGSADADGTLALYFFDFGDGTETGWVAARVVNHTYATAGNFTVRVRVQDDLLAQSAEAAAVVVVSAPTPPPAGSTPGFEGGFAVLASVAVALASLARRRRPVQ